MRLTKMEEFVSFEYKFKQDCVSNPQEACRMRKFKIVMIGLASIAMLSLSSCKWKPSEEQIKTLEETKAAALSAEKTLAEKKAERQEWEKKVAAKKAELQKLQNDKQNVENFQKAAE
jgi:Flp pilus assembly protein TadB